MKRCRPPSAPTVRCWSTSSSPREELAGSRRRSSWSGPKGFVSLYIALRAIIISGRGDGRWDHRTGENQLAQVKQKQYVEPDQGKAVIDLRSDIRYPSRARHAGGHDGRPGRGTMCMATTLPSMNCSAMPPTWPAKKRRYFYPPAPRPTSLASLSSLPARRRVYRRPGGA